MMKNERVPEVSETRALTDRWVGFLQNYFINFGLPDADTARTAAVRVVTAVHTELGEPLDGDVEPLLLGFASRWVESFARESAEASSDWFWRAPSLLARFPATFLETPLPSWSRATELPSLDLLPEAFPRTMPQQEIAGPFAAIGRSLREAWNVVAGPIVD
jgi:hypothetical protein